VKVNSMPQGKKAKKSTVPVWLSKLAWGVAIFMVALMVFVLWQKVPVVLSASANDQGNVSTGTSIGTETAPDAAIPALPQIAPPPGIDAMVRETNPQTVIPTRGRTDIEKYTIQKGDSIFGISKEYKVKPETILWANYDTLQDDPQRISIGDEIKIPAIDGILYTWKEGDTLESVAERFKANVSDIIQYPGNKLDIANPEIKAGTSVMIPGGSRELKPWIVAVAYAPKSGVNKGISGPGGCQLSAGGGLGSGGFVWPTVNHFLSGNDYWSGHLGIDIAAAEGAPVYASDSGVVVYAGVIGGGYGNMIMIDHNNGFHSLYAHLSVISVRCGQSVGQGNLIGLSGSTGNSTGPHLHFEVRHNGGFVNPWYVLP
jgi:LysM repeat protein